MALQTTPASRDKILVLTGLVTIVGLITLILLLNGTTVEPQSVEHGCLVNALTSYRSIFLYIILLAGVQGAYFAEVARYDPTAPPTRLPEKKGSLASDRLQERLSDWDFWRFSTTLILGGVAALVVGVLIPLVLLGRYVGTDINTWVLVALAAAAGYRSREALSGLDLRVMRLLEGVTTQIDHSALSETVRAGVHDAFAAPSPVNFDGFLNIALFDDQGNILVTPENPESPPRLQRGKEYNLRLQLHPDEARANAASFWPIKKHVIVTGGTDSPASIPFRFLVDFGLDALPAQEREIAAYRYSSSEIVVLRFRVPEPSPPEGLKPETPSEILVGLYQQRRYCDTFRVGIKL